MSLTVSLMMTTNTQAKPTTVKNSMVTASTSVRRLEKYMKDSGKTTRETVMEESSTLIKHFMKAHSSMTRRRERASTPGPMETYTEATLMLEGPMARESKLMRWTRQ